MISISAAKLRNRKSERGGDGMHQHISGSKSYAKVKSDMVQMIGNQGSSSNTLITPLMGECAFYSVNDGNLDSDSLCKFFILQYH